MKRATDYHLNTLTVYFKYLFKCLNRDSAAFAIARHFKGRNFKHEIVYKQIHASNESLGSVVWLHIYQFIRYEKNHTHIQSDRTSRIGS